jgi:hypothetical protein
MTDDERDHVIRQLFEMVVTLMNQSYETGLQVAALRAWVTADAADGDAEFEKVVAAARARTPEAAETLATVQKLLAVLKVPKQ